MHNISHAIYELLWQALRFKLKKDVVLHVLTDVVVSPEIESNRVLN